MANSIRYSHPVLSGVKIENKWSWDADSKSECVSLTADNRNAYFFDNPYTISRGTAGFLFIVAHTSLTDLLNFHKLN